MASEKRLAVLITANAKQARGEFGALGADAEKAGKRTQKALGGIRDELLGLGVGVAAYASFKAFEDSERIARQTEAVIKSTGGEANITASAVGDLASEISKLGGVDDEAAQAGANMLLTFTKVRNEVGKGNDIFNQATMAASDYAAATGTDVVNANKMLGKALNDPLKGMAALTRAGVSFTQQQKDQVKALTESGDVLGAQKIILSEFEKQYGGSLEANATASGKMQVAVENLGESVGQVLAPAMTTGANAVSFFAQGFTAMPEILQTATVGVTGLGAAAIIAGPRLAETAGLIRTTAGAAKTYAADMVAALDSIAATRGVSRTTAGVEALKGSLRTTPAEFGKFNTALLGAAAGAGAFTLTLGYLEDKVKFKGDLEGLSTDLSDFAAGLIKPDEAVTELGGSVDDLATSFKRAADDDLGSRLTSSVGTITDFRKANNEIKALDETLAEMVGSGNIDSARKAHGELAAAMMEQGVSAETVASLLPDYNDAIDRAGRQTGTAAIEAKRHAEENKSVAESYAAIKDEASKATSAISDYFDAQTAGLSSQIGAEAALDTYSASLAENGRVTDINTEAGRANQQALIAAKDAAVSYAMTLREQPGGTQLAIDAMNAYRLRLVETWTQAGYTKAEISRMQTQMGLTERDITTTFHTNASEVEQRIRLVSDAIREMAQTANEVGGSVLSGTAGRAVQESIQGLASGGAARAGTMNLVGESGPELVVWGDNGTVIPADKTKQMLAGTSVNAGTRSMGGGNIYVTVNVAGNVTSERALAKVLAPAIFAEANRQTRMGQSPLVAAR